ncbi:C-terminal domain of CHU protein family protein, partial [Reichenbachiella faecimaris]
CVSPGTNIGNGDLTVQISGGAAVGNYTFRWFRGTDVTDTDSEITGTAFTNTDQGSAVITGGDDETISDLSPGQYTVLVTDNDADDTDDGCFSTTTFTITNVPASPTLDEANIGTNIVHVDDCGGANGSITITDADVTSGDVNDYDFTWYSNNPLTDLGVATTTASLTGLEPGLYYVKATDQSTGCNTGQVAFEVEDQSEAPEVTVTVNTVDTSCDSDANEGNGALDWEITNDDGGNYSYQWYAGTTVATGTMLTDAGSITGSSGAASTTTSGTLSGIDGGAYIIVVTDESNPSNTCSTEATLLNGGEADLLDEDIAEYEIVASTIVANTFCGSGSGSFEVTDIEIDGVSSGVAGFDFSYTKADGSAHNGTQTGTDPLIEDLEPGVYEVTFTHTATQCEGATIDFEIEDDSSTPTISFTLDQADQYCTGGNGELTIAATDATSIANGVTYLWGDGETTAQITGLEQDTYTVTVTDAVTGCSTTDSYVVPFDPIDILIDVTNDVVITPTTECSTNVNGSIEITAISPDNVTDYNYTLHTGTYVSGGGAAAGSTGLFENLAADTYYVEATSTLSGCTSKVFEFIVEDESTPPVVALTAFSLQGNCDPTIPNGSLTVTADGSSSLTDYSFDWTSASGTPGPGTDPTYSGLAAGTYTVEVQDLNTLCISTEEYGMVDDPTNIMILNNTLSANENCDPVAANGSITIDVIIPETGTFEYYLFEGEQSGATPNPSNQLTSNTGNTLEEGDYTILVRNTDTGCDSDPHFVEVLSDRDDMQMTLIEDHALTKCDFVNVLPDGQATIVPAPQSASRYTVYWHDGPSLADVVIDSAYTVDNLMADTYTIEMIDRITGCTIEDQITISTDIEIVPEPLVELINDETNCITPNGAITASINESVAGYTFEWQDDQGVTISSSFSASGLVAGTYSVRATDLTSECVSEAASIAVQEDKNNPVFTVGTTESNCSELEFGSESEYVGNGEAVLNFTGSFSIEKQYWANATGIGENDPIDPDDESSVISTNEQMSGLSPGDYKVLVIDDQDCSYQAAFSIDADIEIFNGVSDNGDGKNDYFRISCATRFENNSLKIYTRSGTLVYETSGYEDDSNGNVFTGKRNTGLGGGNNGLPSGTYFYIFDKGDGKDGDVYQGYLELVR